MKGRRARSEAAVADAVVRLKRGLTAPHRTNVSMNTASLRNLRPKKKIALDAWEATDQPLRSPHLERLGRR
jgi:hypothetical protein